LSGNGANLGNKQTRIPESKFLEIDKTVGKLKGSQFLRVIEDSAFGINYKYCNLIWILKCEYFKTTYLALASISWQSLENVALDLGRLMMKGVPTGSGTALHVVRWVCQWVFW